MNKTPHQLTIPTLPLSEIATASVDTMRSIDQAMVRDFKASITMMMEHAGRHAAAVTSLLLDQRLQNKTITLLVGKGNNGGDALAAARHLHNWGAQPTVILANPINHLNSHEKKQIKILKASNIPIQIFKQDQQKALQQKLLKSHAIIDGLIGYNLKGKPRPPYDQLIAMANQSKTPICAIDIPSGLSGNSGKAHPPTIKASTTITLGLPKQAFTTKSTQHHTGTIYLGDLSLPVKLFKQFNLSPIPQFNASGLMKLHV